MLSLLARTGAGVGHGRDGVCSTSTEGRTGAAQRTAESALAARPPGGLAEPGSYGSVSCARSCSHAAQ